MVATRKASTQGGETQGLLVWDWLREGLATGMYPVCAEGG